MHDVPGAAHSALAIDPNGTARSTETPAVRAEIGTYLAGPGWHMPAVQTLRLTHWPRHRLRCAGRAGAARPASSHTARAVRRA
jgi:hypothetical protein